MENKILVITHNEDAHADAVISILEKRRQKVIRWNTNEYYSVALDIRQQKNEQYLLGVPIDEIQSVYFRRLSSPPVPEDAQKFKTLIDEENTAMFESVLRKLANKFMVNNYAAMRNVLHNKYFQLEKAQSIGLEIPRTLITNEPVRLMDFYDELNGNVICKLVKSADIVIEGRRKLMYTQKLKRPHLKNLDKLRLFPVIFQEIVKRRCDVRLIVVGEKIFAAEIYTPKNCGHLIDYRQISKNCEYAIHSLPAEIYGKILRYMKELNLLFGAIDMILTPDGRYVFLELNVCGQWLFLEEKLNFPITQSIANLLI